MGASTIEFHNSYSTVIFVAYLRLDYGCGGECGEPWDVLGWVRLAPGDTQSRANPTGNGFYYYYAEAVDGAFWSGPYIAEVTDSAFNKCTCLSVTAENGGPTNPYRDVGFRELNTNQYGGVNFTA
jgi:Protein of unknown function (DUF1036)